MGDDDRPLGTALATLLYLTIWVFAIFVAYRRANGLGWNMLAAVLFAPIYLLVVVIRCWMNEDSLSGCFRGSSGGGSGGGGSEKLRSARRVPYRSTRRRRRRKAGRRSRARRG